MTKAFLIGTVESRISGLLNLLISAKRYIGDWQCVIIAQGYTDWHRNLLETKIGELMGDKAGAIRTQYFPERLGPFEAKMRALETEADLYLVLEDDMILVPDTDYDLMVKRYLEHREIGLLVGHYCRNRGLVEKAVMKDYVKREPLVGTNGGMLFDREIRDLLLRELSGHDYLFDDLAWCMCAYVNGYKQGRYYGSLAVHHYGQQGGFTEWVKTGNHELPDPSLIQVRMRDNGNAVLRMGNDELLPKAHELYERNKRLRVEAYL